MFDLYNSFKTIIWQSKEPFYVKDTLNDIKNI